MKQFTKYTGGIEEITLLIDGGEEYSLVEPESYRTVIALTEYLEARSDVAAVLSYVPFVSWINGRLSGSPYPIRPESAEEIGESLELLVAYPAGISILSLLDREYSTARVLFRFREEAETLRTKHLQFRAMLEEVEEDIDRSFPDLSWRFSGSGYRSIEQSRLLLHDQWRGIGGYFLVLAGVLSVVFPKKRYVLSAMLPPLSGVFTYLGLSGLLGIPITAISGIVIALVMGVTVDDVVYFLQRYRITAGDGDIADPVAHTIAHTGIANVQTTLVLCTGVAFLAVSFFRTFMTAALPAIISMCVATAVTLVIVPLVLRSASNAD